MKKVLLIMAVLFIANLGCKKMDNGGGVCACSPMRGPEALLVIKNSNGTDLLNDKNPGAYTKDKIQLYIKGANDSKTQISVALRQPFSYGNNKFDFYNLYLPYTYMNNAADNNLYLKLGDAKEYKLTLQLAQDKSQIEKLLIDGKDAVKDVNVAPYVDLYYLTE